MVARKRFASLLGGVAGLAVATAAIAQIADMSGAPPSMARADDAPAEATPPPIQIAQTNVFETTLARLNVPAAGLFSLRAPANTGIQIFVDGMLTIDASGTRLETIGTEITGLMSLRPGDHVIEVRGIAPDHPDWFRITLAVAGGQPVPLASMVEQIDAQTAAALLEGQSMLTGSGMMAADGVPVPTSAAMNGGTTRAFTPFVIGGASSSAGTSGTGAATGNGAATTAGAQMPGMVSGRSAGTTSAASGREIVTAGAMGGGGTTGGVSGGTGGMGNGTGGTGGGTGGTGGGTGGTGGGTGGTGGGTGGTGGGTTPTPTPTPTPNPTAPPAGSAQVTPLSPPANVALTSAVQLTSAGDATGRVPNTGTTLFGAVMDNSMFDIVNVAIAPANRTTTVNVGPMTGQFAVRLFPEDFAQGNNITVTLTGASTASDQVAAQPVSYSLTGAAVQDGVTQALSRLTYGATPELYARIRAIGFAAFVEEQLNPDAITDTAFNAMNVASLLRPTTQSQGEMFNSIMAHDIAHAAFSEKQLREVMGQFWMNHFFAATKDTGILQQNIDDRAFFRANAFGRFEDLLLYSARSPLMSQFLDNDQNRRGNLNENYGREILELSSVGVNAGYTDEDVREVARIFTGWGYIRTNPTAVGVAEEFDFQFFPDRHDTGNKTISFLNMTITGRTGEAGVQEGEELITALSRNVNTRNFVCGKIVQLLVADTPPADFIASCAMAWESTDGDIEAMLRAILLDPAYITNVAYQRNKVKTPFEYAVSAIRALGATPQTGQVDAFYRDVRETFERAGQPILYFQVPTGLPEVAGAWTSSATMIASYNEMMDITENRERFGIDLVGDITAAGLETAEEVAAYLLTISTADRFTKEEFDAIVSVLKGPDGIFEPRVTNETLPLERAIGLLVVTPSFLLQ